MAVGDLKMQQAPIVLTADDGTNDDTVMQDLGIAVPLTGPGSVADGGIDYEFIRMGGADGKVLVQILVSGVELA